MGKGKFVCGYKGCTEVISSRQKNRHFEDVHKMDLMAMTPEDLVEVKHKCEEGRPEPEPEPVKYVNPILENGIAQVSYKKVAAAKIKSHLSKGLTAMINKGLITVDVDKAVQSRARIVTIEEGCIVIRVPMLAE